ncbi:MAG: hypothetical protein L0387_16455 [Acidobacteria bacterium]|nr:hypothetical protein [Acidobacteriota bacterium]
MKRRVRGLDDQAREEGEALEGVFLVRVERASYKYHPQKPFFTLRFRILEPSQHRHQILCGRLYSTEKALWKLNWFLRDFGYDQELHSKGEIEDRALVGLIGVVKVSRVMVNGRPWLNLEGFARAGDWEEHSGAA